MLFYHAYIWAIIIVFEESFQIAKHPIILDGQCLFVVWCLFPVVLALIISEAATLLL